MLPGQDVWQRACEKERTFSTSPFLFGKLDVKRMRMEQKQERPELEKIIYAKSLEDFFCRMKNIPKENVFAVVRDDELARELVRRGVAAAVEEDAETEVHSSFPYVVQCPRELSREDFVRMYQRQKGLPWEILKTERTRIREFCMEDLDQLFELYSLPEITRWVPGLRSYEEEAAYQRDYIQYMYGLFGYGMWLVFEKRTGKLIGRAGVETNEACRAGEAELGYLIHPAYQKQGIAVEVGRAILKYAKETLGLRRIFARIRKDNAASLAVAKKLDVERVILPDAKLPGEQR